jgi:hypothetical protein
MDRLLTVTFFTFALVRSTAMGENQTVDVVLPTDNDALFSGGGAAFYQYIERNYKGMKSTPWEGGQYGFVRDPTDTRAAWFIPVFMKGSTFGLSRDAHGEPLDEVHAIADGKVVHANLVSGYSNYGKIYRDRAPLGQLKLLQFVRPPEFDRSSLGDTVKRGQRIAVMGYTGTGLNRERAHLHLELNLMLSHQFEAWYNTFFRNDPNHNGIYNGMNLSGSISRGCILPYAKIPH